MDPASSTPSSNTPILDRARALPPRVPPGSGLFVVLAAWVGGAVVVAACLLLDGPPILRQWIQTDLRSWLVDQLARIGVVGFVVATLAAYYLMVAIHELGHVVAGLGAGFRFRSLRVGPLMFHSPFRMSLYRGPGALVNGVAELVPVVTDNLAWRGVAMVLGGPFANFLSALIVLLVPQPLNAFSGLFVIFSIVNGVNDLFPFEGRLGISDGSRIRMLLRQPARGKRWLALLRLGGELNDGIMPESLSPDFLAKAIATCDDSQDTVTAHAIAFSAAFHQRRDDAAAHLLETCLAYSKRATPVLREALMSDAAVFQARRRRRADLAEQWLADIPTTTQNPWFRSRAEAAILEANGDTEGALRMLAEVETKLQSLPKNAQREMLLRLLLRWKTDLGSD